MIIKSAQQTEEDMKKINRFTRRSLTAEEVYCFHVILCDNEIDRDYESFTVEALHKLAELFIGKTGIFNHDPKGENQTARIYDTQVLTEEGKLTQAGEVYTYLFAKAYMVRSQKNADLILDIDAGIKKEVSVDCSVASVTCSVCGTNLREKRCEHTHGAKYNNKLCYSVLGDPTDAYEWSFVAVPAQKNAGVTKRYSERQGVSRKEEGRQEERFRQPEELAKLFEIAQRSIVLTKEEAMHLGQYLETLKRQAEQGKAFRKWKEKQVKSFFLLQYPELSVEMAGSVVQKMTDEELSQFEGISGAQGRLPQLSEEKEREKLFQQKEFKI